MHPIRQLLRTSLLRQRIPARQVQPEFPAQIVARDVLRCSVTQRCSRSRLFDLVLVADNLSRRADVNLEFLLLLRPEKPHVPIPDIQLVRHQPVRLLQPHLPLHIRLRVVVHLESNRRLIPADVLSHAANKFLRSPHCLIPRNLEVHRRFRKRPEKIFLRKHHSYDAQQHP